MPVEELSVLKQACELIVEEKLQTPEQIAESAAFSRNDLVFCI
jgi:hypothetical protein